MFPHITFSPQLFKCQNQNLVSLLKDITDNGIVIGLQNKDWNKTALETIQRLPDGDYKLKIEKAFKNLKLRNKLVYESKLTKFTSEWLLIAQELNSIKKFDAVVVEKDDELTGSVFKNITSLDDDEEWDELKREKDDTIVQFAENLEEKYIRLLSYAKNVSIIDPYFDPTKKRYKDSLLLMAKFFGIKRNTLNKQGSITINAHKKILEQGFDANSFRTLKEKVLVEGHTLKLFIWDDSKADKKMHRRYILTEQTFIVVDDGFTMHYSEGTQKDSTWTIKNYKEKNTIENDYIENSSDYELVKIL